MFLKAHHKHKTYDAINIRLYWTASIYIWLRPFGFKPKIAICLSSLSVCAKIKNKLDQAIYKFNNMTYEAKEK